ncbi:unnamed protein product [Adineta ricciae]|uniref:Uncharacterized protein n=1 Tax=Adineta ricciae TaxID=249248 RepID=A0A814U448_ADIRI|nr:unnamed protein product [Adineta ricciae]
MLSKRCQRHHSFLQSPKFTDRLKQSTSGTLSSDTTITTSTSSGYSTGGSSVATTIPSSGKRLPSNQHKVKPKGLHNFLTKLKTFIITPKAKHIHLSPSKDMPITNIILQSSSLSSSTTSSNNPISLPFTYINSTKQQEYHDDSYVTTTANFEKIAAWLDHTDIPSHQHDDLLFIDDILTESRSTTPIENNHQMTMKKLSSNSKAPKRSTSLVATLTRPIIERKTCEKPSSPTLSFSSSILARGMTERITPQVNQYPSRTDPSEEQTNTLQPKSNRRRAIDFSRRRTVAGPADQLTVNKENFPSNPNQQIYRFSPTTSTNPVIKKYYFHPSTPAKNEDILMNSYGLTILQQQRQSSASTAKKSQPSVSRTPSKTFNIRPAMHVPQYDNISDSLDDLLCDREVESYFYPNRYQTPISIPQHIYVNLGNSTMNHYQPSTYIHSTLC